MSPALIVLTGPIGAGKNTVADRVAVRLGATGRPVAIIDLDDVVAATVVAPRDDPWPVARRLHGETVGRLLRGGPDVIAVGPFFTPGDHEDLLHAVPPGTRVLEVLLDAPVHTTWARVQDDPGRALSREHAFHHTAHARYLGLRADIPADLVLAADTADPDTLAARITSDLIRL